MSTTRARGAAAAAGQAAAAEAEDYNQQQVRGHDILALTEQLAALEQQQTESGASISTQINSLFTQFREMTVAFERMSARVAAVEAQQATSATSSNLAEATAKHEQLAASVANMPTHQDHATLEAKVQNLINAQAQSAPSKDLAALGTTVAALQAELGAIKSNIAAVLAE